jgi:hypothetical protein
MDFFNDHFEWEQEEIDTAYENGYNDGYSLDMTEDIENGFQAGLKFGLGFGKLYLSILHWNSVIEPLLSTESGHLYTRASTVLNTLIEQISTFKPENTEIAKEQYEKILTKYKQAITIIRQIFP